MASRESKSPTAFRTISEVADSMQIPQHVLRFWESKFSQISPMKRGGGRRYYRPEDIEIIEAIRKLLHEDGFTIKGAQKYLREKGVKSALKALKAGTRNENDQEPSSAKESASLKNASSVEEDDEAQILTISEKSKSLPLEEVDIVTSLKSLRSRLEKVRQQLKSDGI